LKQSAHKSPNGLGSRFNVKYFYCSYSYKYSAFVVCIHYDSTNVWHFECFAGCNLHIFGKFWL